MEALISVNSHTEVKRALCIGCGVCVNACTSEAISLKKKEREQIPPKDRDEMYKNMIVDRYGLLGALKIKSKAMLGKKI
jgi:Fe-S-cluster-containing hydrogenase component 2